LDLQALGIQRIDQLDGADPQALFVRLAAHQGGYTDRCNLYVYRCAVYYAEAVGTPTFSNGGTGRTPLSLRYEG